jgi:hypothetical protein
MGRRRMELRSTFRELLPRAWALREYAQATGAPTADDHSGPLSRSAAVASMTAAVVPCTP